MFDSDIDSLLDVAVPHFLVDDNADGCAGDIVDYAGLAVVDFVRHAFLDGPVGFDVDNVTDSVRTTSAVVLWSQGTEVRTCMV